MQSFNQPIYNHDNPDKKQFMKNHSVMPLTNGSSNGIREYSPPPTLERITQGSIPISLIADRVIRRSYGEFLNLAETLPAMTDVPKKKRMLEYLLETRRQMIKLLVLVKWARVSKEVEQCIDVVHFLRGQRNCFNNIIIALQDMRRDMTFARLRNPDLRTAIDVLSTGNFPTFPNKLTSQFIPPTQITPAKALATLKSLNTLLHLRLTLHEVIPIPLSNYIIADGRVTFIVPNEWQLTITISDEFDRWWFVDFKDANGEEVGPTIKRRIQHVLEEAFERCKLEYGLFPMGVTEESLKVMNKKAPLVEAYNILHRFHLVQSLSTLHISLHRLSLSPRFSPYIQVVSTANREQVELQYWLRGSSTRPQQPRYNPVRLYIANEDTDPSLLEAIYSVPGGRTALDYERTKIGVRWIRDGVEVDPKETEGLDLSNAEKLVEHVTKIHARTILERIAIETGGITFWDKDELYFSLIDSSRKIRISVDLLTGRIILTEASTTSAMLLPPILQQAQQSLTISITSMQPANQTGPRPPMPRETIASARLLLLKSYISKLAEYKGWTIQRYAYGYIHKPDLDTFLPPQWTWDELVFLSLGKETVVVHALARQGWIIDLQMIPETPNLRIIWVDKIAKVKVIDHLANWLDWLDSIRFYVRGRFAIYGIEKGLQRRDVEYKIIQAQQAPGSPLANQLSLPLLTLKTSNLITEKSSCWASDNLLLRVMRSGDQILAVWEGKVKHSQDVERLLSSISVDDPLSYSPARKSFILKFTISEESTPDHVVGLLIDRLVSIERILQLVREARAVQPRFSNENVFRVDRFSLLAIECSYGVDGPEGELYPVAIGIIGKQYEVHFRPDDPHDRFRGFISGWYNASGGDIGALAELVLHATLPLYKELRILESLEPESLEFEGLYNVCVLPKSVTSVRIYFPEGPYMLDMSLKLFDVEEYGKWMQNTPAEQFSHDKHAVWHIVDVALNPDPPSAGDGQIIPLPGLQDVWNQCGSLMGPKAHWVVPLGRGMLCDAQEGGRALKGIWGCVLDAVRNPNVQEVI